MLLRMIAPAVLALACTSKSSAPPPATTPKPMGTGAACNNACIAEDSTCHEKCLDDDSPPPEEGDSCASKCSKTLERCVARCK